jgi:shikimate kinase
MLLHDFFITESATTTNIAEIEQPIDEGIHDPNIFKAIFMAGPPGAGKNVVIKQLGLTGSGLKLQDIDHTLAYLNKRKAPAAPDYGRGLNTTLKRQEVFQQSMLGLLINTTGRDYEHLMNLNAQLKKAGYDTFMLFVHVDYDVAFDRIKNRETSATDPADKNRKVDLDYFNDAYDAATQNMDFYSLMFGNQFALVSNNGRDLKEDAEEDNLTFQQTLKQAAKKVQRFLRKPLTPVAQQIVSQSTPPTAVARAA